MHRHTLGFLVFRLFFSRFCCLLCFSEGSPNEDGWEWELGRHSPYANKERNRPCIAHFPNEKQNAAAAATTETASSTPLTYSSSINFIHFTLPATLDAAECRKNHDNNNNTIHSDCRCQMATHTLTHYIYSNVNVDDLNIIFEISATNGCNWTKKKRAAAEKRQPHKH